MTETVPMPEPAWPAVREPMSNGRWLMYTADQLRTYADACAQQARREALEAAACVCDVTALESLPDDFALDAVEHCAAAIRALREKT